MPNPEVNLTTHLGYAIGINTATGNFWIQGPDDAEPEGAGSTLREAKAAVVAALRRAAD